MTRVRILTVALISVLSGCSATSIRFDECVADLECVEAFGVGSACEAGFCSASARCETGHDCRRAAGGGACIDGECLATLPVHEQCRYEPEDLPNTPLVGPDAPLVVGGMFLFEVDFSPPIQDAARLAIREINEFGGLELGRPIGLVYCDNGGQLAPGPEREARTEAIIDHLAGTLGVPAIVGPLTSGDAFVSIPYMLSQGYPTLMISPSATNPGLSSESDRLSPEDFGLFWRTAPSDELQGKALANFVARTYPTEDDSIESVVAAYRDDPYGLGLAEAFQSEFSGTTELRKFDVDANLGPTAKSAADAEPDAVLFVDIGGNRATDFIESVASEPALASLPLYLADGSKVDTLLDPSLPMAARTVIFNNTVGTVAAPPAGPAFDFFASIYEDEWGSMATSAFTANGFDAVFVAAAGIVWAARNGQTNYDGRDVARGLTRLNSGMRVQLRGLDWPEAKGRLSSGAQQIDIDGVSGPLDFDNESGQAPAAIEVWKPSNDDEECEGPTGPPGPAPCFLRLDLVDPSQL